jgi:hypothetical protein
MFNDTFAFVTNLLITWNMALFEKVILAQLEIPCLLRNPKVHYRVYKMPLHMPSQVQILTPYFSKIHFNITSHLRLCLPSGHFSSGFPATLLYVVLMSHFPLQYIKKYPVILSIGR